MPLYEYDCEQCANRFELIRKFSDPPLDACPTCGGPVRKQFSSPAIQFKGSGWYITDYAKKPSTEAGQSGSGKDSAEKSESSGKPDAAGKSDSGTTDSGSKPDSASSAASTDTSSAKTTKTTKTTTTKTE